MAELTLTTFLSLDGIMQAPGAPDEDKSGGFPYGGWMFPFADNESSGTILQFFSRADAFLLGRKTYDIFAAYWPRVTDPNDPIAQALNTLPKFVASRTRSQFDWSGTSLLPDVVSGVAGLKQRFRREVQVHGSGDLAQTLIANDLIDEYRLMTFPVVLGTGKRLFAGGSPAARLDLVRSYTTKSGVVISLYRRGGQFTTGTIGQQ
jgi:dihydrofolate reductase